MNEFLIKSQRAVLSKGLVPRPAAVLVRDGKIADIFENGQALPTHISVIDTGLSVLMPGVVDTHAHINEPGRTDWEGFQTATRAAAAGGITTVIDMPLNSIPATTSLDALRVKAETAREKCSIDYGFWGGVIPGNSQELTSMIEAGARGFKTFLCDSGVSEFPMSREVDLQKAMPILAQAGVPLLVHAELDSGSSPSFRPDSRSYDDFLQSRPKEWETSAIQLMIRLARETSCRVHIVHLSAATALKDLRAARAQGVPITAETCPHYLYFESEKIAEGATQFKCCPPIREHRNREMLWQGLKDGDLEFVVSDHSPCTPDLKLLDSGDFAKAWGGISGLQFSLPVVWTEMKKRDFSLLDLCRWMCENTAKFAGLGGVKGKIERGYDADFVVWDPEKTFRVQKSMIHHKNNLTPYEGSELAGVVQQTFVRGSRVYKEGQFPGSPIGKQI